MNGVLAMVSPGFFDKLIGHSKVEEARRQPRSGVIRLVQGPQHCRRVRPRRDHQVKPRLLARNPDSGRGREGIECDRRHETDHAGRLGAAHRNAASLRVSARAAVAARRRQCAAQQERPRQAERRPHARRRAIHPHRRAFDRGGVHPGAADHVAKTARHRERGSALGRSRAGPARESLAMTINHRRIAILMTVLAVTFIASLLVATAP